VQNTCVVDYHFDVQQRTYALSSFADVTFAMHVGEVGARTTTVMIIDTLRVIAELFSRQFATRSRFRLNERNNYLEAADPVFVR